MALDTALEGKPIYYGLGIGLVLAAGIVFGAHQYLIKPINADIASVNAELDELSKKIQAGRAAERKLPQFREQVAELERELEKLRRILPSSRNTEEIIKKMKALVDQGNFNLRVMTFPSLPETATGDTPIVDWPINVELDGAYHDLAIFFNRLSNFARIMNVENVSLNAITTQDRHTLSAKFTAKTFVYIEPKEDDGSPGGTE